MVYCFFLFLKEEPSCEGGWGAWVSDVCVGGGGGRGGGREAKAVVSTPFINPGEPAGLHFPPSPDRQTDGPAAGV